MNFHTDEWIMQRLQEHYEEAKSIIPEANIVGIFLQGSQNYGLDYEGSDVDSKCIVTPTLDDLIYDREPKSYTHVRANDEHIDIKDIRLYTDCFRKQNVNFVEILFTNYFVVNPMYQDFVKKLTINREKIAHLNVWRAVKCMEGTAGNKYAALEHPYPSKLDILAKYGYDPKQLHHLFRMKYFLEDYLSGVSYERCLKSDQADFLVEVKNGKFGHTEAKALADALFQDVKEKADEYCNNHPIEIDKEADDLLTNVQHDIMFKSLYREVMEVANG